MQNPLKDFFYFSRGERRGILILIAATGIVLLSGYLISAWQHRDNVSPADIAEQAAARQEYEEFIASLEEKEHPKRRWTHTSYEQKEAEIPVVLAPFNPNRADSMAFRHLGLPAWMVKNILHYRSKGGKFRKPEDFKKIYGMTEEQYSSLSPYIYIAPEDTARNAPQLYIPQPAQVENMKYASGTVIDLNLADTTELKKIPGIGSGIARLIVGYRQRLGGFYQIEQLKDIHLDTRQLQAWFSIKSTDIHHINLNRSSVDRLRSHPYINFYQAKAIIEYRKKKGSLTSLKPFTLYEEFTEADLERISHYVCFE
ncbi:helix-hairpin-helix domain-containing protein [uncultured Bacteroides sp.]|uniref:helix-hairpin-helix domain-containing protein n=1 Tax=uncultured Bacteroides sp. TaxID=162156 RepID=UPI0025E4FB3E|nr:helix-hairpin-helix domain-containing protein [uncultured Bacteroides sp.]